MSRQSVTYCVPRKGVKGVYDVHGHRQRYAALANRPLYQAFNSVDGVDGRPSDAETKLVPVNVRAHVPEVVGEAAHKDPFEELTRLVQQAYWPVR